MFYVVYLTIYQGNKLPPFYIGYTREDQILQGYNGTVTSKRYKDTWKKERREHPYLFKTVILSRFATDLDAIEREKQLHKFFDVVNNPMYINMSIGCAGFGGVGKNNSQYGRHKTSQTRQKMSASMMRNKNGVNCHHTEEFKQRLSKLLNGNKRGLGKRRSEVTKQLLKKRALNRPKTTCPHCGKTGQFNVMKRWHFDKCYVLFQTLV